MNVAVAAYTAGIIIMLIFIVALLWGMYQGRPINRWHLED